MVHHGDEAEARRFCRGGEADQVLEEPLALVIGAITISIGVTLIASARKGLFEVMVTVFGIFIGPMLIPMLPRSAEQTSYLARCRSGLEQVLFQDFRSTVIRH